MTGDLDSTAPRRRVPRPDLLGLLVAAASAAVFVSHGFLGRLDRDLAIYTYAGQRVADGLPPYVGIVNRSGPLSHLAPGLGIWVGRWFDAPDVTSARVLFLVLSVAAVYAAHRLGRALLGSPWLGAGVGLTLVAVHGFVDYASRGPREKTLMVLLLLLALEAVVRRRWATTGVLVSLATLTWQPVFFAAIATALVGLALERRGHRWRALLRLGIGGVVPLGAFMAWYAAIGHLQDFLDCFVLIHVRYTRQQSALHDLPRWGQDLVDHYGFSLWVMVLGLVASMVAAVVAAVRLVRVARRRTERTEEQRALDAALLAIGVGTVASLAWTVRAYNGWPDAFLVFPFAVAGIAVVLGAVRGLAGSRAAVAVALAWSVAAVALGAVYAVDSRSDGLELQRAHATAIMAAVGPDATMLSIQAPAPLVVTGHVDPIRHQMFSLGLQNYVAEIWPGGLAGLRDYLLRTRPTVVVVAAGFRPPWVEQLLEEGYARVGFDRSGGYSWFVSNEVPEERRTAAQDVLRDATG
ncbi:hypothetical protein [Nocardioides marmoribigeumensis]|uniref:4-amino-4-deoxy-L-arabinose transferase-like glycosyltransferase n=1 Tax=Nocardioides marmoribigeumensis TaxID=433649 RepID=A0ABU2BTN0_9ACTN|nr:hypothetical protein [Nocardioides marmoribigeumensis]MDR7361646.1 4-amino-4-deoxy-L-arabinose transferase-like glycosyltransferase [Nocardioides marmoribigeumensis]